MTFGERLSQIRLENGYKTRKEFANKLGIPETTSRNYETNQREPGHTFLRKISCMFNMSIDYLLCMTDNKRISISSTYFSKDERQIIDTYRNLNSDGKEELLNYLDYISTNKNMKNAIMFSSINRHK